MENLAQLLVDVMLYTHRTLQLANVSQLPHENINILSDEQLLCNDLCLVHLWNVSSGDQNVLNMGSTKPAKFPIFPQIIKGVLFPERSV